MGDAGLLNSIGLPDKGLERFLGEDLPMLAELPAPLVASVMGFDRAELGTLAEAVGRRSEVSLLELNLSCPNVETGLEAGGLSGPAIRAIALHQVSEVAERVGVPVIGMGGVATGDHAADLLAAGATAVAVGTESFRDPGAGRRVSEQLAGRLAGGTLSEPRVTLDRTLGKAESPANQRETVNVPTGC